MNTTEARRTVNIALVGGGFMGKEHSKAYALAPVICPNIAATPVKKILCDTIPEVAEKNAKLWGYEEWTTDLDEILARDDIDIVDFCTPPFLHAEEAIATMKAGKFVILEKPMTTTVEDAEAILEAARKYNGRGACCFNKRRWPAVNQARKLIKDGAIGIPLIYNGRYCLGGGFKAANWYSFRSDWKTGGGFADSTSHIVDLCNFILDDDVDELVADVDCFQKVCYEYTKDGGKIEHPRSQEDLALITARMKSGVHATFYRTSMYHGAGENLTFEVLGTTGGLRWTAEKPSELWMYQVDHDAADESGWRKIFMGGQHAYGDSVPAMADFGVGVADQMSFQAYEFINAYVNGTEPDTSLEHGYKVVKVCDAARQSQATRGWIKI